MTGFSGPSNLTERLHLQSEAWAFRSALQLQAQNCSPSLPVCLYPAEDTQVTGYNMKFMKQ